jgi:hypothetical protein
MNERDRAGTSANAVNRSSRSPFQGEVGLKSSPGLKPWAMIYNRFAVNPPVASQGASSSSSSSNPATRSDGVLECGSTAPSPNCTPRPRGWGCRKGRSTPATFPRLGHTAARHVARTANGSYDQGSLTLGSLALPTSLQYSTTPSLRYSITP